MIDTETEFWRYKNIADKAARRLACTGIDVEDLKQDAALILLEQLAKFKIKKPKIGVAKSLKIKIPYLLKKEIAKKYFCPAIPWSEYHKSGYKIKPKKYGNNLEDIIDGCEPEGLLLKGEMMKEELRKEKRKDRQNLAGKVKKNSLDISYLAEQIDTLKKSPAAVSSQEESIVTHSAIIFDISRRLSELEEVAGLNR